jgi:rhodanese-related sulfurtransferase
MTRRLLAGTAAVLGVLALFGARAPKRTATPPEIAPVQVAEWIRDRKPGLRIIDIRTQGEFDDYHLPRAEWIDVASLPATSFHPDKTLVVVSDHAVSLMASQRMYVLRGGIRGWLEDVMNPTITADASPAARAAYARASVISRYFGGVPRVVDKLPETGGIHSSVSVRRRGC